MAEQTFDKETVADWFHTYSNWGRWGDDDEVGTLNLISTAKVVEAARLVRQGKVISLALPFDANGPQSGRRGRFNPIHFMLQDGGDVVAGGQDELNIRYADDAVTMPLQCGTQWDSLAHIFFEGKMYNGYDASLVGSAGAKRNGIQNAKDKIVSRGVLLDVARFKSKPWLEAGEAIYPEDLEACAESEGVTVGPGDILVIRTGQMAEVRANKSWGTYAGGPSPGLSMRCAPWLSEKDIAGYATDTWGTEVIPNETADVFQPLHAILLVGMGMLIGEIFDLEALADDCAADGVYEFLLVAPPLPITGAVGSPVNPLAIK